MRIPSSIRAALLGLACSILAGSSALADVWIVDASGGGDFVDFPSAIQAVSDGDVLLVRDGLYGPFLVDGKALSIVAERGATPTVMGTARVQNLGADETVVLSGLSIATTYQNGSTNLHALVIQSCAGAVRVQDCALTGAANGSSVLQSGSGGRGVQVTSSLNVVLTRCTILGGRAFDLNSCCEGGKYGGDAVRTSASIVSLYDCELTGGRGGDSAWGGDGGAGVRALDFGVYLANCAATGGKGGTGLDPDFLTGFGGKGGDALVIGATAQAQLLDNLLVGGEGGESLGFAGNFGDGAPIDATSGGTVVQFPGTARSFELAPSGWQGSLEKLTVRGEPGDQVWFPAAQHAGFRFVPGLSGVWAIALPVKMLAVPQGVVPASGTLELLLPIAGSGREGDTLHFQGIVRSAGGQAFLGTPTAFTRLQCDFSQDCDASGVPDVCEIDAGIVTDCNNNGIPDSCDVGSGVLTDCNQNGIADACDIAGGTSLDCNENGLPDECEVDCNANGVPDSCDIASGASFDANFNGVPDECQSANDVYHVDQAGPLYGADGSPAKPFRDLAAAFDYAIDGNTILVADGTYTGPENRGLVFGGRDLAVVGTNGAAAVVLDLQQQDRAFTFDAGTSMGARIEGLTIRNGSGKVAASGFTEGGGVLVEANGGATLLDCVIEWCSAQRGGGVQVDPDVDVWIEGCTLANNTANLGGLTGGGGLSSFKSGSAFTGTLVLRGCSVVANFGGGGSGLWLLAGSNRVESCTISNNHPQSGIEHLGAGDLVVVDSLLVQNEGGGQAGGIYTSSSGSRLISHCTLIENIDGGIGILSFSPTSAVVENCLFLKNTAHEGGGLYAIGQGTLSVRGCTFSGNAANVGGAVGFEGSGLSASVRNCVLWDNAADFGGASFYANASVVDVDRCDVQGGLAGTFTVMGGSFVWGANNIDVDPLFADVDGPDDNPATWADNDYRLGALSPCADAGDNAAVGADVLDLDGDLDVLEPVPFDLDVLPRFEDDPAVPDTGAGTAPIVDLGAYERP